MAIPFEDPLRDRSEEDLAEAISTGLFSGHGLGNEAAVLIMRLLSRIGPTHPAFAPGFSADNLFEMASEFFAEKGTAWAGKVLILAPHPGPLVGLTVRILEDWLTDRWRKTAFGSVHHRLAQVLSAHPQFTRVGKTKWWLAGVPATEWDGRRETLFEAARRIEAPVVAWKNSSRRAPLTTSEGLVAVLEAVLGAAGGPLSVSELTEVCLERFPHSRDPLVLSLDDGYDKVVTGAPSDIDVVHDELDRLHELTEAIAIVTSLTADQRTILRYRTDSHQLQRKLKVGRSQAAAKRNDLELRLLVVLNETSDPHAVGQQILPALGLLFPEEGDFS